MMKRQGNKIFVSRIFAPRPSIVLVTPQNADHRAMQTSLNQKIPSWTPTPVDKNKHSNARGLVMKQYFQRKNFLWVSLCDSQLTQSST